MDKYNIQNSSWSDTADDVEGINRQGDFMQVYNGTKFWPLSPKAEEVDIIDLAHSLSMQCRYNGHCKRFYSVAEHSVLIARWLLQESGPEIALWGLLHDASEAYLADVPRPLKPHLSGYKTMEARVMTTVCDAYGLPYDMPAEVHEADTRIIADELVNMKPMDWHKNYDNPLGVPMMYWTPEEAKEEFLNTFSNLVGKIVFGDSWEDVR